MKNFNERVYEKLREVPKGKVVTYKGLGRAVNSKAYRAVGKAMRNNKDPLNIKCYKVIKSSGEIGGYCGKISGNKIRKKINLLRKEGIEVKNNKIDLKKYLFKF